jgi:hypothetical protein
MTRIRGKKKIKKNYRFGRLLHYYTVRKGGNLAKALKFYINVIRKKKKTFKIIDDAATKSWGTYSLFSWWLNNLVGKIQKQILSKPVSRVSWLSTADSSYSGFFDKLLAARSIKKSFTEFKNQRSTFFLPSFLRQLTSKVQRKSAYVAPKPHFLLRLYFYFFKSQFFLKHKKKGVMLPAAVRTNRDLVALSLVSDRLISAKPLFKRRGSAPCARVTARGLGFGLVDWNARKSYRKTSRFNAKRPLRVVSAYYTKGLTAGIIRKNIHRRLILQAFFWFSTLRKKKGRDAFKNFLQNRFLKAGLLFSKGFGGCFVAPGFLPKSLDSIFLQKFLLHGRNLFIKSGWMLGGTGTKTINLMPCLRKTKGLNYIFHIMKLNKSKIISLKSRGPFLKKRALSGVRLFKKVNFFDFFNNCAASTSTRKARLRVALLKLGGNAFRQRFFLLTPSFIGILKRAHQLKMHNYSRNRIKRGQKSYGFGFKKISAALGERIKTGVFKKSAIKARATRAGVDQVVRSLKVFGAPKGDGRKSLEVFKFLPKAENVSRQGQELAAKKRGFKKALRNSDLRYSEKRALRWQYSKDGYNNAAGAGSRGRRNQGYAESINTASGVLYRAGVGKKKEFFGGGSQRGFGGRFKDRLPPFFVSHFFKSRIVNTKKRNLRKVFTIPGFTKAASLIFRRQPSRGVQSGLGGVALLRLNFLNYAGAFNQFFSKKIF